MCMCVRYVSLMCVKSMMYGEFGMCMCMCISVYVYYNL